MTKQALPAVAFGVACFLAGVAWMWFFNRDDSDAVAWNTISHEVIAFTVQERGREPWTIEWSAPVALEFRRNAALERQREKEEPTE